MNKSRYVIKIYKSDWKMFFEQIKIIINEEKLNEIDIYIYVFDIKKISFIH